MKSFFRLSRIALLAVPMSGPILAQVTPPMVTPAAVTVNMRDAEIADVAQEVSRITRRTIILDPAVKGVVNVVSSTPQGPEGVWQLFVSVLRGQGFAVVRNGRAWRVIPQANAAHEPASSTGSGRVVTRTIRLNNVSPDTALRVFKPLIAGFGSIEMVTNPNAIVVTDYADNVARIEGLVHALDRSRGAGFDTIKLRYAPAKDVAAAIQGMVGEGENAAPRAVADPRSNTVLVRGEPTLLAEARRIASMLDHPSGTAPTTRVFRLRYNDAEAVTEVLRGLIGGQSAASNPVARTLSNGPSGGATSVSGLGAQQTSNAGGFGGASGYGGSGQGGANSPITGSSGLGSASGMNPLGAARSSGAAKSGGGGFVSDELAVEPAPELNAIVVRGAPAAILAIESLITQLDVRRPQVMIEAAIVEITSDRSEQLGVQLGLGAAAAGVTNSAGTSFSNLGLSLGQVLSYIGAPAAVGLSNDGLTGNFGKVGSFGVLIQALGQSTRANLLSTPSITTLDNQPAEIVVGQNVPFRTGSYATAGNTTTPFTTIERADVGITLRVVPRVHEGDTIRLDVSQEVSSLVGAVTGAADLVTNRRSIQTTVLADDGQTIVLGGLISDDDTRRSSKVPVLGDIPVLGNLFKSHTQERARRTLFVFLRPTILRDTRAVSAAAATKYERIRNVEANLKDTPSLLLEPITPRLPVEIQGIY